jgi:hypothetical protein
LPGGRAPITGALSGIDRALARRVVRPDLIAVLGDAQMRFTRWSADGDLAKGEPGAARHGVHDCEITDGLGALIEPASWRPRSKTT